MKKINRLLALMLALMMLLSAGAGFTETVVVDETIVTATSQETTDIVVETTVEPETSTTPNPDALTEEVETEMLETTATPAPAEYEDSVEAEEIEETEETPAETGETEEETSEEISDETEVPEVTEQPEETEVPAENEQPEEEEASDEETAEAAESEEEVIELEESVMLPAEEAETIAEEETESEEVNYDWSDFESNFSMFKVTSCTVVVKGETLTVTMGTSKNTYDKIYIGSKNDEQNYPDYVQGVKKANEDGYIFTFELPASCMGQSINFVPGKPDGTWYSKNQYQLVIPAELGEAIVPDEGGDDDNASYEDGDYSAEVETWNGFKLEETKIKVSGNTMQVTLISGQLTYDCIYIGAVTDIDKSNYVQGVLTNGNTAFAFTFELPVSALGTKVSYTVRKYGSSDWSQYGYSFTLPSTLGDAAVEEDVNINDYADGEYTGTTSTYNETTVNGETAYNNNAAFTARETKIVVNGDTVTVTLIGTSATRVSFSKIYLGNKANAEAADDSEMIYAATTDSSEGGMSFVTPSYTFTLPKSALGTMVRFSAYSTLNEVWYEYVMKIATKLVSESEQPGDEPQQPDEGETGTLDDGDYSVTVESNAGMFKVIDCVLTAKNGEYTAVITLSGTGYDKLFVGTAEDAAKADESQYVSYVANEEGKYTYTIPVAKLDTPIAIAAHSSRNDAWYDRELTFKSETAEKIVEKLEDGDYNASVENNNSMFNVIKCVLSAKNGEYTATITLSGTGYDMLYLGTAENAAAADESAYIAYAVDDEGKYTFTFPVAKMDEEIAIAAHAVKSGRWSDKPLIFKSEGLDLIGGAEVNPTPTPEPTVTPAPSETPAPELDGSTGKVDSSTALADGTYTPDKFSWSGGSGRISISCSKVTVSGGQAVATLVFSSSNMGYVKANGRKYYPSVSGGASTFNIPVNLNANNKIIGMTTAMSAAHEVTYTIYIYIQGADASTSTAADAEAPSIVGLTYESTEEMEYAQLVHIYRYEGGFTAIEVDGVGRFLTVPENAEIPVGLEEDAMLIDLPIESVYVAGENALKMIDGIEIPEEKDIVTAIGSENIELTRMNAEALVYAGECDAPDYAALLKSACDFAIMSEIFAVDEGEELPEELVEIKDRFALLGIPMFVDRSMDEESEHAQLEWIKVYGILLGCEDEAVAAFTAAKNAA